MRRTTAGAVRRQVLATLAVTLVCLGLGQAPAAATLKADYRFNDSHASSLPGAPDLTDIDTDPGTGPGHDNVFATETAAGVSRRVLTFPRGNGLRVSTAGLIPTDSYAIVVLFRFTDTGGYRRILDLKDGTTDTGLYDQDGALVFYNYAGGQGQNPITPSGGNDPYHEVVLTRDSGGTVVGLVDGAEQFRFTDSDGAAVIHPGQTLRFLKDDEAVPGEESAGAVANIRLYDGPVFTPPPVLGETVNVSVVSGTVLVAAPGKSRFVPLTRETQIPVGSKIDTKHGTVGLISAADAVGTPQPGQFRGGIFKVGQARAPGAVTELRLTGGSSRSCKAHHGKHARAARRGRSHRTIRRLFSNGSGRFRTRGHYSAATVRGTAWATADRCDGTLTRVTRGTVSVKDYTRHRTVLVRAGHSYLAPARG